MDTSPLVRDEIDAGAEFLKRLNAYRLVKAACWLRKSEDEERYLYVALEALTAENTDSAYDEVLRIAGEMKDQYLDPFRVKVIAPEHRVAQALAEIYRRFPGRVPTWLNGRTFAGMAVAEVYIYPEVQRNP
jgi:hypothetical protein